MYIKSPPECPHDCIYPSGVPCPYTLQPSCPKEGVNSAENSLSSDDLPSPGIGNSLLGDLDPFPVKTKSTQPIATESNNEPRRIGIVPLKKEPYALLP
jgi:hypothetical protein